MKKFDTIVEKYMKTPSVMQKDRYADGKPKIMIFSFDPNGVNTFRSSMMQDNVNITKGVVEVNSEYLPTNLISLKVYADNPAEEEVIRELALSAGGVEYVDGGIDKDIFVLPNG